MALSESELRDLRLRALRLVSAAGAAANPTERIAALGDTMFAMQGQDVGAVLWAIGLRTGVSLEQVKAAFDAKALIRSWPMRGTVHALRGEDIGWIQGFTTPRLTGSSAQRRREYLQLDLATIERVRDIAREVLVDNPLSRDEFFEEVGARGVVADGPWRYHIVWYLAQTGTVALGPFLPGKTEQALVLLDEWIPNPRALTGDEALAELVLRYLDGHGPATVKDLMWWVGLPGRDVKRGVAAAGDAVVTVAGPGNVEYLVTAAQLAEFESLAAGSSAQPGMTVQDEPRVHLLPAFDEHLLGYTERSAHLDPAHFATLVPGRNGVFKPTVVVDGVALGTWTRLKPTVRTAHIARMTVTPFDQATAAILTDPRVQQGLEAAAAGYGTFLGLDEFEVTLT